MSVYFLVEYIKGMELFDVIREMGLCTIKDT
jgi:cGMP-dependent protein kinase